MYGNNHEKERSLKSIYDENHFTYKLFSLKIKHRRAIIIETFKIITKESPLYMHDLVAITNNKNKPRYNNRTQSSTVKNTWYGLNSFKYFALKTWNELSSHLRKELYFDKCTSLNKRYREYRRGNKKG